DEGPALADLAAFFFFLPTAGELTADSTLFFFDLCRYGYGYSKRPYCYSSPTASSFPLERSLRPDFFGCFFRPLRRQEQGQDQDQDQDQDQGQDQERDQQQNTGTSREQQPLQQEQQQHTNVPTAVPYLRPLQSLPSSSYSSFSSSSLPESFVVFFVVFFFVFSFLRPYPPPTTFLRKGNSVLTEDLPWPAAKIALLRYYRAFDQIRTVSFYEKLRRHEARRPKTKDTIDWLEKHAFFYRKVGPGPGPDESTEHSYGLFQALPKEIQVQLYDKLERPSSLPYGILFSTARLFLPLLSFPSFRLLAGLRCTRPEGLGGSRDAGPAVAGPRPPYVTEAVRGGYGTATPYSGYGRTGRTSRTKEGT
ncbi:hypothetical protein L249_8778, partial [Ophiocordyceps polyrhachis-furcata BCC 54312]